MSSTAPTERRSWTRTPANRHRLRGSAWALFLAVVVTAGSYPSSLRAQEVRQDEFTPRVGELEFRKSCATCHGPGARGDGPMAEFLTVAPPDLTRLSRRNGGRFPATEIYRIIDGRRGLRAHGGGEMPIWGDRYRAEVLEGSPLPHGVSADAIVHGRILSIVFYLETLQEAEGDRRQ